MLNVLFFGNCLEPIKRFSYISSTSEAAKPSGTVKEKADSAK